MVQPPQIYGTTRETSSGTKLHHLMVATFWVQLFDESWTKFLTVYVLWDVCKYVRWYIQLCSNDVFAEKLSGTEYEARRFF